MKFLLHNNMNDAIQRYNLNLPVLPNQVGIICEEENTLIGYLYYTINHFHPHSIYLHFNFLIENPDVDILNKMFSKLKVKVSNYNYIFNSENHFSFYKSFINNNGFIEMRKTYEPEISTDNLIFHYNYIDSHDGSVYPPFVLTDELVHKVQDIYRSTHVANPLGDINLQEWKTVITNDLDLENSIIIYSENKEITAYLFIFHGSENVKEIGWVYFKNEVAKKYLLKQFKFALCRLKKSGIKTIGLEVDNTDKYAYDLFSPFLNHAEPSLITYIKHKP